jgi:drug/metabolite transporter (DMT)-like permease
MGGCAICMGFYSITRLGLVKASIIVYMYPVFAAIFSRMLLKEHLTPSKAVAIATSFLGVFLVMSDKGDSIALTGFGANELIAVLGAVLGGLTVVLVKKLQSTETTAAIFFAQCLVGLWIVLIPAGAGIGALTMSTSMIMIAIGLLATAGQLLSTDSYRYLSVVDGSILIMAAPVINVLAGIALFHEQVTLLTFAGGAIVLVSTGFALLKR